MRPKERRDSGQEDLLRSRLDAIIDMNQALLKLARTIDWSFLEQRFGAAYEDKPGRPPLPTRLMAGLAILKHTYDLSDEVLCERWVENPYYQFFCGEEFFQHRLVLDRSSLTRWRQRMGEEKLQALLQESLSVAAKTEAIKPSDLNRVIIDTTVQPKNVMFPTDARLLNRAREILVRLAQRHSVKLRQSYARVGKFALIQHQRYAHAKQFKRANRTLKKLRTYLGRVIRDIARKIEGDWLARGDGLRRHAVACAARARSDPAPTRPQVYSLHAPEVECIGKGKAHRAIRVNGMDHARSQRQPRGPVASGAQAMSNTHVATIGIDLGKNIFHVVGLDATGAIALRKKRSRNQLEQSLANISPCLIGMEACAGAHHLGRKLEKLGHKVRLLPAQYVKPYLKGHKNDFRDAEAIAEAVQRPQCDSCH